MRKWTWVWVRTRDQKRGFLHEHETTYGASLWFAVRYVGVFDNMHPCYRCALVLLAFKAAAVIAQGVLLN